MAVIDTTRSAAVSPAGSVIVLMSRFVGAISDWNDARVTRKSLLRLSARELDDIGLSASDIDMIARRGRR